MRKWKKELGTVLLIGLLLTACGGSRASELRLQGIDQLERGKYQEAIDTLDEAMKASKGKISEEQFDILKYRAEAEYMLGEYDQAEKTLDILVGVDGNREVYQKLRERISAKLLVKEASQALNENRLPEARELMDQAENAGLQNDRDLSFNEIVYLEKSGEWQKAYEAMQEFQNTYQGDPEAERELSFLKTRVDALNQNELLSGQKKTKAESIEGITTSP